MNFHPLNTIITNNRCSMCMLEFDYLNDLNQHIKLSHTNEYNNNYICKSCEINFTNNDDLIYHISTMHTTKIYNYCNDKIMIDHHYHESIYPNLDIEYPKIGYIEYTPEIIEECELEFNNKPFELEFNNKPFDQEYYNELCLDEMAMFY